MKKIAGVVLVGLVLAGCSSYEPYIPDPTTAPATTARSVAERVQTAVPEAMSLVDLTEDNDANNLLGRPNGYSQATVIVDKRAECDDSPGVDCGAVVELWPSEEAANKRKDYIQSILTDSPMLGSEYDTVRGPMILRVSGDLKPSQAKVYEQAFVG
ncbi:hypothetical protein [Gordonia sp. QH-12]|uniref:hypothetical protein n=1 Tax=Gordonia sp. QH-12 TaxID=1437876 RepID=UPI000B15A9E9|nr:hypothetical protein [Gordonia sp. QH-12]